MSYKSSIGEFQRRVIIAVENAVSFDSDRQEFTGNKTICGGTSGGTEFYGDFVLRDRFLGRVDVVEDAVVVVGDIGHGITSFRLHYTAGGCENQVIYKREVYKMKEHEQKVIEAMLAAVSELNEFEMGYFLGYAEAKAQEAERKKSADTDKQEEEKSEEV